MDMHVHDFAQYQGTARIIDQTFHTALEGAGRFGRKARFDLAAGCGCQSRNRKFINLAVEAETANKHLFGQRHIDHVDDKLTRAANIGHRVLLLAHLTRLDTENNDRRIMGENVEETHRRGIVVACGRTRRDKRYRPRADKIGQQTVTALRFKRGKIEFHGST
ncbi:hypothetical protein D3C78_1243250 [compost metagenome]